MKIIERSEHPEQYTITELEKGDVFRLPTAATVYIKIGASDTAYNNVNLANGVLGTISESYTGLLKVKGAFVENYKSENDVDSIKEQLADKSEQCNKLWEATQSLKEEYRNLERQLEDQEKQLAERAMSIERLKADRDQLQSMYDGYRIRYAEIEKAYKDVVNNSDTLLEQIIDAAYSGEMKGLEAAIIANPQRLVDKIRSLANTAKQDTKNNTSE